MQSVPEDRVGPPSPGVVESEIDGRIALFSATALEAYVLNATAGDVWRLADGTLTLGELTEILSKAYAVSAADIAGDITASVADLRRRGLLQR